MMASRKMKSDDSSSRPVSKSSRRHIGTISAFLSSSSSSSPEEDEELVTMTGCRSCRNTSNDKEYALRNRDEADSQQQPEEQEITSSPRIVRTEENSLSFKHFLRNGSQRTNFQNSGARPKVYFSPTSNAQETEDKDSAHPIYDDDHRYHHHHHHLEKVYSRNPTELPDFVQDHLVIEQYYLNTEHKQQVDNFPNVSSDNLPDFALNSVRKTTRFTKKSKENVIVTTATTTATTAVAAAATTAAITPTTIITTTTSTTTATASAASSAAATTATGIGSYDLLPDKSWDTYVLPRQNQSDSAAHDGIHNTTRFFARSHGVGSSSKHKKSSGIPLDLPISANEAVSSLNAAAAARDCCPPILQDHAAASEMNVPKSLPDFLNDGPIIINNNRTAESENTRDDISESTVQRILLENEILRHGLQIAHNQIDEKKERIRVLEAELASRKEMEHEETVHLERAMEQVEDNLKHNARRVVNAESTISLLKKEIKSLTMEVKLLRIENNELRANVAMSSRNDHATTSSTSSSSLPSCLCTTRVKVDQKTKRLADDLRNAASTAEVSLRQLLSGVDNLRVLASAVENMDRIEDRTKDFLPPDFDDTDNAATTAAAAGPAV